MLRLFKTHVQDLEFRTLELKGASEQRLVTHVQVLRGSRFADSWDGVGRRWIYLLPRPTAVERAVHRLLWLQQLLLSVAQRIWRMAASWPLAVVHSETEPEPEIQPDEATVTTMVVHSGWPFNMLRVRCDPDPESEVVALMPMQPPPHPPPEERHQWQRCRPILPTPKKRRKRWRERKTT